MILGVGREELFGIVDHLLEVVGHLIEIRVRARLHFLRDGGEIDVIPHRLQKVFVPEGG